MDWVLGAAGLVAVVSALVAVLYFTRMRSISSRVGSFECALRGDGVRAWANGYATYGRDRIDWFPVASLRLEPRVCWVRGEVEVVSAEHRRSVHTGRDVVDLVVIADGQRFDLVVQREAYHGLRSWLEAAPPTPVSFQ